MPFDTQKLWKNNDMLDTYAIKMQMMLDQYENCYSNQTDHLLLLNTLLEFESLPSRILPHLLKVNVAYGNVTVEFDPVMNLNDLIIDLGPALLPRALVQPSKLPSERKQFANIPIEDLTDDDINALDRADMAIIRK
jgi:hypothetical protein